MAGRRALARAQQGRVEILEQEEHLWQNQVEPPLIIPCIQVGLGVADWHDRDGHLSQRVSASISYLHSVGLQPGSSFQYIR